MNPPTSVRIDKWLWAVRLYKTRTVAAEACRNGKIKIEGQPVKPSREVRLNETINAVTGEINRTIKVIGLLEKRVGAPLVKQFAEDLTPASEYEKPKLPVLPSMFYRPKGTGRPTKKDRRNLDKLGGFFGKDAGE